MGILVYIARRCLFGVVTVGVVSLLVFVLTHVLGDPAAAILGPAAQQPDVLAAKRADLGLDRPLVVQYGDWLMGMLSGDPGVSYANGRAFGGEMLERAGNSVVLMASGAVLAIPLAIVIGVRAAMRRDGAFDVATNVVTLVLVALPEFLIGTLLLLGFSVGALEIFPATSSVRGGVRPWDDLAGMVLPSVTMALLALPYVARSVRASMSEVLDSDYITVARINGLAPRAVISQALPNALPPTLQVIALSLAYMAGGAVVVESVFNYPGIGTALVEAIRTHDVPVVLTVTTLVAAFYVLCNLAADIGVVLLTPRIRTGLT